MCFIHILLYVWKTCSLKSLIKKLPSAISDTLDVICSTFLFPTLLCFSLLRMLYFHLPAISPCCWAIDKEYPHVLCLYSSYTVPKYATKTYYIHTERLIKEYILHVTKHYASVMYWRMHRGSVLSCSRPFIRQMDGRIYASMD